MIVLASVGALALVALVAWLSYRAEQRHRAALSAFATARGWSHADSDPSLVHRFSGEPLGRRFGRRTRHVLRGTHAGRPFVVFDYVYKTRDGSGESTRTVTRRHCLTVIELGVRTPGLVVDPENVLERFAGRLMNTDIELESEEFNRAFRVDSRDRRFGSQQALIEESWSGIDVELTPRHDLVPNLVATEDRIAAARRFVNGNVRAYNTRCRTLPSSLVASAFGFRPRAFFEIRDASVRGVPDAG